MIIPALFARGDVDATQQVAQVVGKEWRPLLHATLPKIAVRILPYFAIGRDYFLVVQMKTL